MSAPAIRSVLIAGGGIAAWSAAVALRKRMPALAVTVVDTPPPPNSMIDAVGTMLPSARGFHGDYGIPEDELIRKLGATVRLGTLFEGWAGDGTDYVHAYGDYGQPLGAASFHLQWTRLQLQGRSPGRFDAYCAAAEMARAGRFNPQSEGARHPPGSYEYGLNVEPGRYRSMLEGYARHLGVVRHAGTIARVQLDQQNGMIAAVVLTDGRALASDLYVDATGPCRTLHTALGCDFVDWSRWLFVDRFLVGSLAASGDPLLADRVTAHAAGWLWSGGSLAGAQHGFAYASAAAGDATAARILRGASTADVGADPAVIAPGRVAAPWLRNCVAIGDAAATSEPLEFTGLHLTHSAVDRILAKLPAADFSEIELRDYNRETIAEMDRVRDFIIAHYVVGGRPGDPLWRAAAAAPLPDSLAHTLSLFSERGRLPVYEEETFTRHSWATLLISQGMIPRRVDSLTLATPAEQVKAAMESLRSKIGVAVAQQPPVGAYLRHVLDGVRR